MILYISKVKVITREIKIHNYISLKLPKMRGDFYFSPLSFPNIFYFFNYKLVSMKELKIENENEIDQFLERDIPF
jgi:hypothetical protein